MGLAERLAEPKTNTGGRRCTLCMALEKMDDSDREAVNRALADPGCSDKWLWEQLLAEGYDGVLFGAIGNHRRDGHRP